jgi:RNA polymerase sigma-70 factor (ECF subfamily)
MPGRGCSGVARKTLTTQRRAGARRRSLVNKLAAQRSPHTTESHGDLGVVDALARLSELDREAITLVAWEGLTPNEAAVVVGRSPVAFRVRLHRAKRRLRQEIDSCSPPRELRLTEGELER